MFNFGCKKNDKQEGCRVVSGLTKKQQAIADRE
ncbi:TetR/AcrR family transcriptional regulator, partial [Vibrio harveyi]